MVTISLQLLSLTQDIWDNHYYLYCEDEQMGLMYCPGAVLGFLVSPFLGPHTLTSIWYFLCSKLDELQNEPLIEISHTQGIRLMEAKVLSREGTVTWHPCRSSKLPVEASLKSYNWHPRRLGSVYCLHLLLENTIWRHCTWLLRSIVDLLSGAHLLLLCTTTLVVNTMNFMLYFNNNKTDLYNWEATTVVSKQSSS